MDNPYESRVDRAFLEAFEHFIRINGWSVQGFCRRTEILSEDGETKLLYPTYVTKWRTNLMPSARAAMITAEVFGVPRSFYYLVGELLESGEVPEIGSDRVSEQLAVLQAAIKNADAKDLRILEEAVRRRRDELAEKAEEAEAAPIRSNIPR